MNIPNRRPKQQVYNNNRWRKREGETKNPSYSSIYLHFRVCTLTVAPPSDMDDVVTSSPVAWCCWRAEATWRRHHRAPMMTSSVEVTWDRDCRASNDAWPCGGPPGACRGPPGVDRRRTSRGTCPPYSWSVGVWENSEKKNPRKWWWNRQKMSVKWGFP